jgi:hypothetical protein
MMDAYNQMNKIAPDTKSPIIEAAERWSAAKERLLRSQAVMQQANQENAAADEAEREAWGRLEEVAGRALPKTIGQVQGLQAPGIGWSVAHGAQYNPNALR